ncbi:MAG: redoxin family protein [Desulfobacterales bacterium]|nr:redoxin family protein [Desulfobacterales bacterium]
MRATTIKSIASILPAIVIWACAPSKANIQVDHASVKPGTEVMQKGTSRQLLGEAIAVGQKLPPTRVVDAESMKEVDLSARRGGILFLSIVPSLDTKVCEAQTHLLGEEGDKLPATVQRIAISRDTPFAQKRFAREAKLTDIQYFSDYKAGDFGRSLGLLVDGPMLLARSVVLVDKSGVVRYIQVVPELTHLPDMEKAFAKAMELAAEN